METMLIITAKFLFHRPSMSYVYLGMLSIDIGVEHNTLTFFAT